MSSSTPPHVLTSVLAVFSPIPGQPGILSDASPISASISITCAVFSIPHLSHISLGVSICAGLAPTPGRYTLYISLMCQCADNVVCLIALYLEDGNMVCIEYVLDNWNCKSYCLGGLFSLCFVIGICFVTEGPSAGVECDSDMCRLHIFEHILEGVDKTENSTCIFAFGIDSRILDKCVKGTVYERVCV